MVKKAALALLAAGILFSWVFASAQNTRKPVLLAPKSGTSVFMLLPGGEESGGTTAITVKEETNYRIKSRDKKNFKFRSMSSYDEKEVITEDGKVLIYEGLIYVLKPGALKKLNGLVREGNIDYSTIRSVFRDENLVMLPLVSGRTENHGVATDYRTLGYMDYEVEDSGGNVIKLQEHLDQKLKLEALKY